jgi:hypothetical protein
MRRDLDVDYIDSFRTSNNCTGPKLTICVSPFVGDANTCKCEAGICSPYKNESLPAHIERRFRA